MSVAASHQSSPTPLMPNLEPGTRNRIEICLARMLLGFRAEESMARPEPNPASAKEPAEGSTENVNVGPSRDHSEKGAETESELEGKTDSGPEPEVHGQEFPP